MGDNKMSSLLNAYLSGYSPELVKQFQDQAKTDSQPLGETLSTKFLEVFC